jgi:putative peptidoglycan lipid II flippase
MSGEGAAEVREKITRIAVPAWLGVVGLAVLGKAFAFLREPVIAATLGATASSDAYYVAIGLPFLLQNLLGVPFALWVTARLACLSDPVAAKQFYRRSLGWGLAASAICAAALFSFPRVAVQAYASGLEGSRLEEAASLTRLGALALPALVLQAVSGARLFAQHRFVTVYAWAGAGSLLGLLGVLVLLPVYGPAGAVVAFTLTWWTAALGLSVQRDRPAAPGSIVPIAGARAQPGPGIAYRALVLQLFFQGNGLMVYTFASRLATGDIAATLFAGRIIMAAYETIVLTAGVLVFPRIARFMHEGDEGAVGRAVTDALTWLVPLTVALMVWLAVARADLVTLVYRRNAFDERAAILVSQALLGYAPYILGTTLVEILHRAMVLRGRLTGYLAVFGFGLLVNWLANVVLVPRFGVLGVGLGSGIGVLAAGIALWLYAQRLMPSLEPRRIGLLLGRTGAAAAGTIALAALLETRIPAVSSVGSALLHLAVYALAVAATFGGLLVLLGYRGRGRRPVPS